MLRQDAKVTVYVLKFQSSDNEWKLASLDHFVFARETGSDGKPQRGAAEQAFSASGECWQRYGLHGTLDRVLGQQGLDALSRANPGTTFGLFKLELAQTSTMVSSMAH